MQGEQATCGSVLYQVTGPRQQLLSTRGGSMTILPMDINAINQLHSLSLGGQQIQEGR